MPTKKPKVTIYLTETYKTELQEWAEEEKRSISNLVELLVEKALNERIRQKAKTSNSNESSNP